MTKNYFKLPFLIIALLSSSIALSQTVFEFTNFSQSNTNGSNMFEMTESQPDPSDTIPFVMLANALNGTTGVLISTFNINGAFGTDGNVMRSNPATRMNFDFNKAVDIVSIITLNGESGDDTFTFTPNGGTGSPVQVTIPGNNAQNVALNWQGASGFSVTSSQGTISFFFDTLVISENTLTTKEFSLNKVSIYPNPTNNIINIKSNNAIQNVELYDVLGKKVKTTKASTISLNSFSKGIYIMKVTTDKGIVTKKVTKI
ncbi:T9SS type A sorting domain-containing protein [Lacinutrix venerupis]|uniref:Secretion system C-terminal sorting domain-containing protein n=1 Tax=Lacinutrix venerupis TaxID=1486034 RepID=A0AAC9LMG0_9FLAO|nr:T9SS type A sorting domain-containing protein [Lacinutrix venerupis]APY00065.1 hypothetical protein BWR22_06995 [Lacinutrix venerupis]